jgi:hypothetical protein
VREGDLPNEKSPRNFPPPDEGSADFLYYRCMISKPMSTEKFPRAARFFLSLANPADALLRWPEPLLKEMER